MESFEGFAEDGRSNMIVFTVSKEFTMRKVSDLIIIGLASAVLSGCAVMSEEECRTTNWYDKGYSDGTQGVGSGMLAEYVDACRKVVSVNQHEYMQGRREGAEVYCTNDNAFNLGTENAQISDICSVSSNSAGFNRYYKRGNAVYKANAALARLDEELNFCSEYSVSMDSISMRSQLRANYDYLYRLRSDLANYANYVSRNAYNGNIQLHNYDAEIDRMPYPKALTIAKNISEARKTYDRERDEIDRYMHDFKRCMKDADHKDDDAKYNRCRDRYDCWKDRRHQLDRSYDRFISSAEYGSTSSFYVSGLRSCSTHVH